jgi:molybdopterin-guanine dinucleotide biosynthesis protein A
MEAAPAMAGLVLCGGMSRRMGTEKALLDFEGEVLVVRVARRIGTVASPVVLAPGTRGRLGDLGYMEVDDAVEGTGPLGGLVAGLAASPHPLVAVAAADMPFVDADVLLLLARLVGDAEAAVPVTEHGLQPLHAVYSVRALPALLAALRTGRRALREVVTEALRVRRVERPEWRAADPTGRFALNLNRPEDVTRIGAALQAGEIRTSFKTKEGKHGPA